MQTINHLVRGQFTILLAAVTIFAGCTPPGPRALLKGKELIEKGQYPAAVEELRLATKLMGTNALAWNYLGLACHHAGLGAEAATAYQRALVLDRDLSEAHYNLGCLWLEENKLEGAKAEFLAFTLRRANSAEGLVKLATVQLQLREIAGAEKNFSDVLKLSTNNVEALTGLGLIRAQRGRPVEAVQFFNAALRADPACRPALLNLAIVAHQQLRDRPLALQKYREYLALEPVPPDAEGVRAVVRQLEAEVSGASPQATSPPVAQTAPVTNTIRTAAPPVQAVVSRTPSPRKVEPAVISQAKPTPPPGRTEPPTVATVAKPASAPVVSSTRPTQAPKSALATAALEPKPEVVEVPAARVPKAGDTLKGGHQTAEVVEVPAARVPKVAEDVVPARNPALVAPNPNPNSNRVRVETSAREVKSPSRSNGSTLQPPAKSWPRYAYRNPGKPARGDTSAAQRAFAQGLQAHQAHRLPEAIQAYRSAIQSDPSFFDAQYHLGVAGTESGNLRMALSAYEGALAAKPESADARYNFALVLKQSGYPLDAANELQTLLAKYPTDARAHVTLGNLYAQQLGDTAKARQHYLRVLETDPRHPQAAQIRYWLADNPN